MQPQMFALQVILSLLALFASFVVPQASDRIPQCWQDCISLRNGNCNNAELNCICHLAGGKFLTEVVSCLMQKCKNPLEDPNPRVFIDSLQTACNQADFPIPSAVISSAELIVTTAGALSEYFTSTTAGVTTDSDGLVLSFYAPIISPSTRSSISHTLQSTSISSGASTILSPSASPTATATTVPGDIETATSSSAATASPDTTKKSSGSDGTILDIQGIAPKKEAGSLLGLTVGLLAGIVWF